jgi:O-antigen/teichoic acid export membrane protein
MTAVRERMGWTLLVAYLSTGAGQLASQLFFFLVLRYLSLEGVGLYSWAIAISTIYAYIMDFGLGVFLVGELSKTGYGLKSVVRLVLCARLPLVAIGIIGLEGWARLTHPSFNEYWTLALVTLTSVIQLIDLGLISWFQVRQRQNLVNIVTLVTPLGRLMGIALLLVMGQPMSLHLVVGVSLAAQVMGTVSLFYMAGREARGDKEAPSVLGGGLRQLFRRYWERGPLLAMMYSFNILQARLDWILVSVLVSRVALANYSLANKVIEVAMLVAAVCARTSFPWFSRDHENDPQLRERLALLRRLFFVSCGFFGIGLFFWSWPLMRLFFGDKYATAETAIRLMTLATAVFMLNQYLLYVVLAHKLEKIYTYLIILATGLQVVVDLILLPRIGIVGAAVGMLVVAAGMHVGQLVLLKHHQALTTGEIFRLEAFLLGSIGGLAAAWAAGVGPMLGTGAAALLVGVLGLFIVLGSNDREQVWGWMMRRRALLPAA